MKSWECLAFLVWITTQGYAKGASLPFEIHTVCGFADNTPKGYAPPLLSNGSLCTTIDYLGGQRQRGYFEMIPTFFREGRRYGLPNDLLISFGHFETDVWVRFSLVEEWRPVLRDF